MENRKFIIITDTGSDLDSNYFINNNIHKIKLGYNIDDVDYDGEDGLEMDVASFYSKLREGAMPKTSQINPGVARKHIEKYLKNNQDVLVIAFSSGLSGTYGSFMIAANELNEEYPNNKLLVIDSLSASLGQGLFVDYAVKFADEGHTIDETFEYLEDLKLKIRHEFTVNDLFHLKRGGRVSATSAVVGTIMNIKPILHVDNNGKLIPIDKVRGRKVSLKGLAKLFAENNDLKDNDPVFISHGDALEDALFLKDLILEIKPNTNVYINYIGAVIGSHSGAGTIALFYKGKAR